MIEFEYEITADDYVAASVLFHRRSVLRSRAVRWLLLGVVFVSVPLMTERPRDGFVCFFVVGLWFFYCGVASLYPQFHFRRGYRRLTLAGEKYKAKASQAELEVAGALQRWQVQWPAFSVKTEDKRVFMFYAQPVMYIIAKRYLTMEQQQELRDFAGLKA